MKSPYLLPAEACAYLRFVDAEGRPKLNALRCWADRHRVPKRHRGRSVLYHIDDLDAALTSPIAQMSRRSA